MMNNENLTKKEKTITYFLKKTLPPLPPPLVPDVLQRGSDVNLLGALCHAVQHHVKEDVGAGPPDPVTARQNIFKIFLVNEIIFFYNINIFFFGIGKLE